MQRRSTKEPLGVSISETPDHERTITPRVNNVKRYAHGDVRRPGARGPAAGTVSESGTFVRLANGCEGSWNKRTLSGTDQRFTVLAHPSSIIHHPPSIIHHPSSIILLLPPPRIPRDQLLHYILAAAVGRFRGEVGHHPVTQHRRRNRAHIVEVGLRPAIHRGTRLGTQHQIL